MTLYSEHAAYLERLISRFKNAKDAKGNPLYPLFEEIRDEMGRLMDDDRALRAMPDGMRKMVLAYELATDSFTSQAETNEMLARTLRPDAYDYRASTHGHDP